MLEHGLLVEAKALDDMRMYAPGRGKDEDSDDDGPKETYEEFETRVNAYVAICFQKASSSKRDHYKDGLVYQERRAVIQEFLKTSAMRRCQNPGCGAYVQKLLG